MVILEKKSEINLLCTFSCHPVPIQGFNKLSAIVLKIQYALGKVYQVPVLYSKKGGWHKKVGDNFVKLKDNVMAHGPLNSLDQI